MIPATTTVES